MSSSPARIRGHCPECGPDRWADIKAHVVTHEARGPVWAQTDHRILQYPACETIYHQTDSVFSEDEEFSHDPDIGEPTFDLKHTIHHWPSPLKRERPEWLSAIVPLDLNLYQLLQDAYSALDNDLNVLAAIGLRTAFDRSTEVLGIDAAISFFEKLEELEKQGFVGITEKDILSTLTDAGSAAAHRGWRPSTSELDTMMSIVEGFLQRTLITRTDAKKLKEAVPAKQKRQLKPQPTKPATKVDP